jgi:hypothetical protein
MLHHWQKFTEEAAMKEANIESATVFSRASFFFLLQQDKRLG